MWMLFPTFIYSNLELHMMILVIINYVNPTKRLMLSKLLYYEQINLKFH